MSDEEKQVEVSMERILFQVDESDSEDIHRSIGLLLTRQKVPKKHGNMIGRAIAEMARQWFALAIKEEVEKPKGLEWAKTMRGLTQQMCGKLAGIEVDDNSVWLRLPDEGVGAMCFQCQSVDHAKRCAALYEPFLQELLKGGV